MGPNDDSWANEAGVVARPFTPSYHAGGNWRCSYREGDVPLMCSYWKPRDD